MMDTTLDSEASRVLLVDYSHETANSSQSSSIHIVSFSDDTAVNSDHNTSGPCSPRSDTAQPAASGFQLRANNLPLPLMSIPIPRQMMCRET